MVPRQRSFVVGFANDKEKSAILLAQKAHIAVKYITVVEITPIQHNVQKDRAPRMREYTTCLELWSWHATIDSLTLVSASLHMSYAILATNIRLLAHTAIDCGEQGIPSALPYLSHRSTA